MRIYLQLFRFTLLSRCIFGSRLSFIIHTWKVQLIVVGKRKVQVNVEPLCKTDRIFHWLVMLWYRVIRFIVFSYYSTSEILM